MTQSKPSARIICGDARTMPQLADASVDLVVTSPPYWHIKDYRAPGQIGHGQSLHEYLSDLCRVWGECARVLKPGRRLCINIGDQFARAVIYARYKIIPLHADIIAQASALGLDYLGSIIWQKKTTMQTTGGAVVMGSFPFPPNGIVELDYEFILLFKKPGKLPTPTRTEKEASRLTTEEWKEYFSGHWTFGGARQSKETHEAVFPEELPRRLIRMFTFAGETVLDPFLGSGTTAKVAAELGRNAVGYEINRAFLPLIRLCCGTSAERHFACFEQFAQTTWHAGFGLRRMCRQRAVVFVSAKRNITSISNALLGKRGQNLARSRTSAVRLAHLREDNFAAFVDDKRGRVRRLARRVPAQAVAVHEGVVGINHQAKVSG